jgi:hypothetical protein
MYIKKSLYIKFKLVRTLGNVTLLYIWLLYKVFIYIYI